VGEMHGRTAVECWGDFQSCVVCRPRCVGGRASVRRRGGGGSPVGGLGLVELVLDLGHVLWRHAPLGEIDVPLLLVHTQDERDLLPADVDLRRAASWSAQLSAKINSRLPPISSRSEYDGEKAPRVKSCLPSRRTRAVTRTHP
jgi:hypothetical protein